MPMDLEIAFCQTVENIDFDWPETLAVDRIKIGIAAIAVSVLVLAGSLRKYHRPRNAVSK